MTCYRRMLGLRDYGSPSPGSEKQDRSVDGCRSDLIGSWLMQAADSRAARWSLMLCSHSSASATGAHQRSSTSSSELRGLAGAARRAPRAAACRAAGVGAAGAAGAERHVGGAAAAASMCASSRAGRMRPRASPARRPTAGRASVQLYVEFFVVSRGPWYQVRSYGDSLLSLGSVPTPQSKFATRVSGFR